MVSGRPTALALAAALMAFGVSTAMAQDKKTYKVALDGTFAPHAMPKPGGGIEGFNVDFANELGKRLGAEMQIDAAQFSGLIPAMQSGRYDFLVAPVTITEERAKTMLFSEGYLPADWQFVVKKGGPKIEKLEDLEGMTIAVNKGALYDRWGRENADKYGWTIESYGTQTDALQAVLSGRADTNFAGVTNIAWAVKQNPMLELSLYHETGQDYSVPFRKDDHETRNKVDAAIECMKRDGTLEQLALKWLGITLPEDSSAYVTQPGYGPPGFEGYDPTEHTADCG